MGGTKFAYPYTKKCLEAGKHVVTSNKELVADFGDELLTIAKAHNVSYLFEASTGGGIPIIRPIRQAIQKFSRFSVTCDDSHQVYKKVFILILQCGKIY